MSKPYNKIKNDYQTYTSLRTKRKTVLVSPIDVTKAKERFPSNRIGTSNVSHAEITKNLHFEVEAKINNSKDFKFKLFCSDYCEKPFFRYDSDGPPHKNDDPTIPLVKQQVTTPHFHEYNSKGIEIAYKTKELITPEQINAMEDINSCIDHFCSEGNIRYKKTEFPKVVLQKGELPLTFTDNDPLKNINF